MTAATTVDAALTELGPYLRPGFAERYRALGKATGYRALGRALCYAVTVADAPSTNGAPAASRAALRGNGRATTKPTCPWGWKHTKSGSVRNRRHVCSAACGWTSEQCLEWLDTTPYPTKSTAPAMDYTGWASCLCGLSARHHVEPKANEDGTLAGYGEVECEYSKREPVAPDLFPSDGYGPAHKIAEDCRCDYCVSVSESEDGE